MIKEYKVGETVFLTTHPEFRGNVSAVDGSRFRVTWHKASFDRPDLAVEKGRTESRMRVWYDKGTSIIGFDSH